MFNHLIKILWFARCCLCALWHLFRYLDSTYPYLYYNVRIKLAKEKHRTAFELIARAVITSSSAFIGNGPINHWILSDRLNSVRGSKTLSYKIKS